MALTITFFSVQSINTAFTPQSPLLLSKSLQKLLPLVTALRHLFLSLLPFSLPHHNSTFTHFISQFISGNILSTWQKDRTCSCEPSHSIHSLLSAAYVLAVWHGALVGEVQASPSPDIHEQHSMTALVAMQQPIFDQQKLVFANQKVTEQSAYCSQKDSSWGISFRCPSNKTRILEMQRCT